MIQQEIEIIHSVKMIADYCRDHVCTQCILNIGNKNEGIQKAQCVCDYNILHLPSTWKTEELKDE